VDAPEATVLYKKKKVNLLDQALSYVSPPAIYPSDASISESVTSINGIWPPTRLQHWKPDVDTIANVNIYHNLNTLMDPCYEFSKQKNSDFKAGDPNIGKGIPDYTCRVFRNGDGKIVIPIEIKRNLVVESLINDKELALKSRWNQPLRR
ncbi:21968_t:CDS:2, partial [Racocetra persica]